MCLYAENIAQLAFIWLWLSSLNYFHYPYRSQFIVSAVSHLTEYRTFGKFRAKKKKPNTEDRPKINSWTYFTGQISWMNVWIGVARAFCSIANTCNLETMARIDYRLYLCYKLWIAYAVVWPNSLFAMVSITWHWFFSMHSVYICERVVYTRISAWLCLRLDPYFSLYSFFCSIFNIFCGKFHFFSLYLSLSVFDIDLKMLPTKYSKNCDDMKQTMQKIKKKKTIFWIILNSIIWAAIYAK